MKYFFMFMFIRFFKLTARVVVFPFVTVSFFLSILIIPFIFLLDCFYYLLCGRFALVKDYILNHMDKVAFYWYHVFDAFIGF